MYLGIGKVLTKIKVRGNKMIEKDFKNLEEKLDDIYNSLSHQNILLSEIKEILVEFKWLPVYVIGGAFGWFLVVKVWNFLFGY